MEFKRASGILLHPTSLPSPHGIGSLGEEAYRFVDFLAESGQSIWQILPLGPTGYGDSPYSAYSAFAGNPLLISLGGLVADGDLSAEDIVSADPADPTRVDYGHAHQVKDGLLQKAARNFQAGSRQERRAAFHNFCQHQAYWLEDYALFRALRARFGHTCWSEWPEEIRLRDHDTLNHWRSELAESVFFHKYAQFSFYEQWFDVKRYANEKGIRIFGDLPIFIAYDSVDVWANPHLFFLDEQGRPTVVAGVPPDYFSDTGQRWGNPLYRWDRMAEEGYSWWVARFRWNLTQTDMVRIDHFRGFEAYWEIPAEEKTAVNGRWVEGPRDSFFQALRDALGDIPIIAEDLGLITAEVENLRDRFGFPGMKVLQFAFGESPDNPYLPHNVPHNSVMYTGTHDNDTTLGWWHSLKKSDMDAVRQYLGHEARDMPWDLIRLAEASVSDLCIVPMQDVLGLGNEARMNRPGQGKGNWDWRLAPGAATPALAERLGHLTYIYGRKP